ncbi:NAD-dependent DNA ligase LigA [Lachnospiraceae bacterium C1.1]|nr:NAD-dependent DNA ligase LigA [Lachnospiraceae bacterium C1.1]
MAEKVLRDSSEKARIEELVSILNDASKAYYNGEEEKMSNFEWDAYFDELKALEDKTGYVMQESPTQSTGYEAEGGNREAHEFPALSLAKTKKISDLTEWAEDREIWLSWKLDGLTLVLTYDDGKISRILTRGNGTVGNNITVLRDSISGFPKKIDYKGHLVVRGEATISYPDFEEINDMIEDDDEKYANPRNLASGTLALLDPAKVKERHVHFNAFTLVHIDDDIKSWGERMDFLEKSGFTVVDREKTNAAGIEDAVARWTAKVEKGEMPIPVDGLVIVYEDNDYAMTGSVTGHHATRAGFAFKWQDTEAETELDYIEWSCAVSTISPVAVFKPVQLEGTTVSRASLCNLSEIERLGIGGKGSLIRCIKANKIIPKIVGVTEKKGEVEIPSECPVCHAATEIHISENSGTKTLHCTNAACPAKHLKKFTRFVSKSGMDIDGLSIKTMLRFMNEGFIHDFSDIYKLSQHFDTIKEMEGFGQKSVENMAQAIEKSRDADPVKFIYALCIPMIGTDAAKKIIGKLNFDGFLKRLEENLGFVEIDGIGSEKSKSICEWYSDEKNASDLKNLLKEVKVQNGGAEVDINGKCAGLTFVITGDVHEYKNRAEFKAYVESQNGSVTGSVSKKTDYLVNNDIESSSSKNKKAKELGIPIITEKEFIERFV